MIYDTNWWKSFTHARLAVAMGDRGCLSIFGDRAEQHRMFAEQVTAEYFVKTEGRGRTVDEWKPRPEQPDNHWLDCLVGSAVAASMQGALLFGTDLPVTPKRDRISFREMHERSGINKIHCLSGRSFGASVPVQTNPDAACLVSLLNAADAPDAH